MAYILQRAVSHPSLKVEGGGFLVNPRESGSPKLETQGEETAMQDRKGKKVGKKGALKVVARQEEEAIRPEQGDEMERQWYAHFLLSSL